MKKVYNKPNFNIEFFALNQSIANGCGITSSVPGGNSIGRPNHWEKTTCGWEMGGMSVWPEGNRSCTYPMDPETEMDGVCYNNPEGGNTILRS